MAPPRKRDRATLQDRRPNRTAVLVVDTERQVEVPALPRTEKPLLPAAVEAWERFWGSDVAKAVELDVDLPGLTRWILTYDEWLRAQQGVRRRRIVPGSTGQPVLNPLAAHAAQLSADLTRADTAFGLNPRARASLGLIFGEAKLTAAKLNELTRDRSRRPQQVDKELAEDFEPA